MKKVVQSRWNGCSLSASQASAFGQFSNRCRVALDRGAFSDMEVSTVRHESDEQERTELRHQKKQNEDTHILGHESTFVDVERLHASKTTDYQALSGTGTRYPRRVRAKLSDAKPKEKYSELIANVFESERKAQMKKAEIAAVIKSRYPYFKNFPGLECRISEVLTRNPAFKHTGPGIWALKGPAGGNGQGSRSRKRARVRRRPDFLRLDWKKPGRAIRDSPRGDLPRYQNNRMDTSTESEDDIVKPATPFSSSTSLGEQRIVTAREEDSGACASNSDIHLYKEILMDFNKEILKRVIEEVTKVNQKCYENLAATMKVTQDSPGTTISEESTLPETVRKSNQQLLQETIDKLIADNEKCLMDLDQSIAEYGNNPLMANLRWPKAGSYETTKDASMLEKVFGNSNDTPCTEASGCKSQKSTSAMSDSEKSSKNEKRDVGRVVPYPLPTILKHSVKANNHMKSGKRVIPRLNAGSSTDNAKNPSQSDSSEQDDYNHKFKQIVPGPKQRSVDLRPHSMKTISPSTNSTKIRLSVDPSRDSSPIKRKIKTNENTDESCCHTSKAPSEKSVSDVFAEYARKNSELKDIVAMIDPTLLSALNSQDGQIAISSRNSSHVMDEPCCSTNLLRAISGSTRHDTSADMDTNTQNELRSNKNTKFNAGSTISFKMTPAGTNNTPKSTLPSTSWPNMNPDTIIDVKPNVNAIGTVKHQRSVVASSGIQTTNFTRPTTLVSATRPQPSTRPIKPRPQPQPRVLSNGGIDIRYVPPYRWGYRPAGNTQQSRRVNSTFAARGVNSYHVVYSNARPGVFNRVVGPQLTLSPAVASRRGSAQNDVRCRIRGATVLRFPVRK